MTPALSQLIAKTQAALAGKPALGKSICVDLGPDGVAFVYPNNLVAAVEGVRTANCTITTTIDVLNKLQSGAESVVWADLTGDISVSGDTDVAETFGKILEAAKS